jgi:outer membrane protein
MNQPLACKAAGAFMIRARAIGVPPEDNSSTVSATSQAAPELDFSYFLTDDVALELIAATTRHEVSVKSSAVGPKLDVGSVWALPPALMLQYHFLPHAAFSPYLGVGVDATF